MQLAQKISADAYVEVSAKMLENTHKLLRTCVELAVAKRKKGIKKE